MKHFMTHVCGAYHRGSWLIALVAAMMVAASLAVPNAVAWAVDDDLVAGAAAGSDTSSAGGAGQASAEESIEVTGGWVLNYEVADGQATITGVGSAPSSVSALDVPQVVGGYDVVALADDAFADVDKLAAVTLPSTLRFMGSNAFKGSSLTSIELPAALEYVPYQCFWGCKSLQSVTFADGCTPEYLGTRAFMNCSSLVELSIPPMMGNDYDWICENPTSTFSGKGNWRIGMHCFMNCTKLQKVELLAGNPKGITEYLKAGGQQWGKNASNFVILVYGKGSVSHWASTATWYFAVNFYQSKADAEADTTFTHPWKQVLYPYQTGLLDVLKGTTKAKAYEGSDELPSVPDAAKASGYVWGIDGGVMTSAASTLGQAIAVYPVDRRDLDYGWVSSPELEADEATYNLNFVNEDNGVYIRLPVSGPADISGMAAYAPDGTKLDPSEYELKFERGKQVPRPSSSFYDTVYSDISSANEMTTEGGYRVHAVGTGSFAKTSTGKVSFTVRHYHPVISDFSDSSYAQTTGLATERAGQYSTGNALFMVVASAESWQKSLVATGLAGVGNGQVVFSYGDATSAASYRAIQSSDVSDVIFLGSGDIPTGVVNKVKTNVGTGGHYDTIEGATPEEMSLAVYETVRKFGPNQKEPYDWGDVAVVVSESRQFAMAPIAQYAYQAKAPVFFADSAGNLSSATLSALKDGGFTSIVVAGDATYVSDKAIADMVSATGVTPKRVLVGSGNAYAKGKEFLNTILTDFVDESGEPINSTAGYIVADARDAVNVMAAAQLAACSKYALLAVSTSADLKAAEAYMYENSADKTKTVCLVGDFSSIDKQATDRMSSIWSTPLSTAVGQGDTVEADGILYELTSAKAAKLVKPLDSAISVVVAKAIDIGTAKVTVTAIADDAFAGFAKLSSVDTSATSIGARAFDGCAELASAKVDSATAIGANAFANCKKLSSVSAPKATKIGDKAFYGCTALASVNTAAATSIGANAFANCKKLVSISLPKATKIGDKAFYGCLALKTASIGAASTIGASAFENCRKLASVSTKATSIGASAFKGCSAMTKATLSGAKLATIGKQVFMNCKKLATIGVSSTALKTIGDSAFKSCTKLKTMKIKSKKLTSIGIGAFSGCTALASAAFQSTALKTIGKQAFMNCKKLSTLTLKSSKVASVGANAFKKVKSTVTVKAPKAKLAKYKKLFKKAGMPAKAKYKKA